MHQLLGGMQLGRQSTIATTHARGALVAPFPQLEGNFTPAVSPDISIGPGLTIAQDNTLGSFSPFQGRIYVSFVAHDIFSGNPKDNTYIVLYHSDDGGLSWSPRTVVNDDSIADNFSEGTRPKFEPQLAVDQTTGTVVISFLDTRNDPARARYATYLATSIDGETKALITTNSSTNPNVADKTESQSQGRPVAVSVAISAVKVHDTSGIRMNGSISFVL